MQITDLPSEIIELILKKCTTPAFFTAVCSCKRFYDVASEGRAAIIHHFQRVPGLKRDLADISTKDLFLQLRKGLSFNLCNISRTADLTVWQYPDGGIIDAFASSFESRGTRLALVFKNNPNLTVYKLEGNLFKQRWSVHRFHKLFGHITIPRTSFRKDYLSVIYHFEPLDKRRIPRGLYQIAFSANSKTSPSIACLAEKESFDVFQLRWGKEDTVTRQVLTNIADTGGFKKVTGLSTTPAGELAVVWSEDDTVHKSLVGFYSCRIENSTEHVKWGGETLSYGTPQNLADSQNRHVW